MKGPALLANSVGQELFYCLLIVWSTVYCYIILLYLLCYCQGILSMNSTISQFLHSSNITREDGRLSKRQLATAYRGYHGLESQYHALLQMSSENMSHAKAKNDHVLQRHMGEMKSLAEKERLAEGMASREIKALREDFKTHLAYQYVYKNHSFKKTEKANKRKKPRPISDKPEMYEQARKSAMMTSNAPRPLGSLRQIESYKNELKKIEFPPINDKPGDRRNKVNALGDNSYEKIKEHAKEPVEKQTAFPNIENAMGVEVKFRYKMEQDHNDKDSLYSAPAGAFDDKTDVGTDGSAHVVAFDMGQNLMLMRKKEQERYEHHRVLPVPPPSRQETRKEGWRRVLPPTPSRPTSVFPNNTKNSIGLKKLLKREATEMVNHWASSKRRLEKVDMVKEIDKTRRENNPLPVFDSNRPTSAIIRDFETYRKYQDDLKSVREQQEIDQPIIVRQLSPKPRPESAVSQRRTEYSRISTPVLKQRPKPESQLRRTDSEIIPSVSRTTSYKQLPDDPGKPHENAMLTAAERIDLEKKLRNSGKKRSPAGEIHDDGEDKLKENRADTPTPKPRRQLPPTPDGSREKPIKQNKPRLLPGPMFNTSIISVDRDFSLIAKVKAANEVTLEIPDETNKDKGTQEDKQDDKHMNDEINQYSPTIKPRTLPKIVKVEEKPEMDKSGFLTEVSASRLRERLAKKMNFDYDSFSRTMPNTKKQLELRAKEKRKQQLKNAKLAEEAFQKQQKKAVASASGERPRSRVSFNENVIVFQTI